MGWWIGGLWCRWWNVLAKGTDAVEIVACGALDPVYDTTDSCVDTWFLPANIGSPRGDAYLLVNPCFQIFPDQWAARVTRASAIVIAIISCAELYIDDRAPSTNIIADVGNIDFLKCFREGWICGSIGIGSSESDRRELFSMTRKRLIRVQDQADLTLVVSR